LRLLKASESHLSPRNVLLRVLQILKERILLPDHALIPIGRRILVALNTAGFAAKETEKIGSKFVASTLKQPSDYDAIGKIQILFQQYGIVHSES